MSIICGYHDDESGETWIGCDSRVSADDGILFPGDHAKIMRIGRWVIGHAGDQVAFSVLKRLQRDTGNAGAAFADPGFQAEDAAELLRNHLMMAGFIRRPNDHMCDLGQHFLLARPEGLWEIDSAFGVRHIADGFAAIGSGCDFASGAVAALRHADVIQTFSIDDLLRIAMEAACEFDSACGGEIVVEQIPPDEPKTDESTTGKIVEITVEPIRWSSPMDEDFLRTKGL